MFKKKDEKMVFSRETWEISREYRKAPFKKRYNEIEELINGFDVDFLEN